MDDQLTTAGVEVVDVLQRGEQRRDVTGLVGPKYLAGQQLALRCHAGQPGELQRSSPDRAVAVPVPGRGEYGVRLGRVNLAGQDRGDMGSVPGVVLQCHVVVGVDERLVRQAVEVLVLVEVRMVLLDA
jgi:hypothetical protein